MPVQIEVDGLLSNLVLKERCQFVFIDIDKFVLSNQRLQNGGDETTGIYAKAVVLHRSASISRVVQVAFQNLSPKIIVITNLLGHLHVRVRPKIGKS